MLLRKALTFGLVILILSFVVFPMAWIVATVFKPSREVLQKDPQWTTTSPTVENFEFAFKYFGPFFANSFIVSIGAALLNVAITIFGGYALARLGIPGRKSIFTATLIGLMFPPILISLPVYVLYSSFRLVDTQLGLILIYTAWSVPFAILLLRGFFAGIPRDLEDSAMIDGCSRTGALFRVVVPLAVPGLVTTWVFTFLTCWNDILFALILTSSPRSMTLPVRLVRSMSEWGWMNFGGTLAAAVIIAIPPMIIFAILQKYFIRGMTLGAVKG